MPLNTPIHFNTSGNNLIFADMHGGEVSQSTALLNQMHGHIVSSI